MLAARAAHVARETASARDTSTSERHGATNESTTIDGSLTNPRAGATDEGTTPRAATASSPPLAALPFRWSRRSPSLSGGEGCSKWSLRAVAAFMDERRHAGVRWAHSKATSSGMGSSGVTRKSSQTLQSTPSWTCHKRTW